MAPNIISFVQRGISPLTTMLRTPSLLSRSRHGPRHHEPLRRHAGRERPARNAARDPRRHPHARLRPHADAGIRARHRSEHDDAHAFPDGTRRICHIGSRRRPPRARARAHRTRPPQAVRSGEALGQGAEKAARQDRQGTVRQAPRRHERGHERAARPGARPRLVARTNNQPALERRPSSGDFPMTTATAVHSSVSATPIPRDAKDLVTVCVLCSHNCGIRVDIDDNRMVAVRPDKTSPITHGYICNKAVTVVNYAHHDQRLEHPLRRKADGTFERIGWDTAVREIAGKLAKVRSEHGGRAIGLVGVGGQANHLDAPWALSFLKAVGSRRWFNAFAQEKTQHNLLDFWMLDAPPTAFMHADMDRTKYLLVLGTNPKISNRG